MEIEIKWFSMKVDWNEIYETYTPFKGERKSTTNGELIKSDTVMWIKFKRIFEFEMKPIDFISVCITDDQYIENIKIGEKLTSYIDYQHSSGHVFKKTNYYMCFPLNLYHETYGEKLKLIAIRNVYTGSSNYHKFLIWKSPEDYIVPKPEEIKCLNDICSVCDKNFTKDNNFEIWPCGHKFHLSCSDKFKCKNNALGWNIPCRDCMLVLEV